MYLPSRSIAQLKSNPEGKKKLRRASRIKSEATRDGKQYAKTDIHKGKKRGEVKTSKFRTTALAVQDASGKYTSSGAREAAKEVIRAGVRAGLAARGAAAAAGKIANAALASMCTVAYKIKAKVDEA